MKNIIPAIASTNAIIAAACALEALKLLTVCSSGIENYMMCAPAICCNALGAFAGCQVLKSFFLQHRVLITRHIGSA